MRWRTVLWGRNSPASLGRKGEEEQSLITAGWAFSSSSSLHAMDESCADVDCHDDSNPNDLANPGQDQDAAEKQIQQSCIDLELGMR